MFFQLCEIRKQEALTQNLEQSNQKTHEVLIKSYSYTKKVQKPLRERFGSILNQSALLLHNLREIQESVKYKCLLPSIFNDRQLNKLIYNRGNLPDWFQHVFQKQYEKQKINIQIISNKFYKLHGLSEKFNQLDRDYQKLQTIFSRYQSITEKQLQQIDIVEEMNSFLNLSKNCKQIFKNFLLLITKKVLQFLQKTIESTLNYTSQLKKVKSSQNLHTTFLSNQNSLNPNLTSRGQPQSPQFNHLNKDINADVTILKSKSIKNINKLPDYYPQSFKNQKKIKIEQNNSTIESLRKREKQNNEFFFRKALLKQKFNDTFQTQPIKSYRSQHSSRCQSPLNILGSRQLQTSRDSSNKKQRNFYQQSLAFKNYQPLLRNSKSIDQRQHTVSPVKNYEMRVKQKLLQKRVQNECLHHCPQHDKVLNNHCSKHCDKLCNHEKRYFNEFGLDLTKMDLQFYKSRQKANQQQLKTYRSTKGLNTYRSIDQRGLRLMSPQIKQQKYVSRINRDLDKNYSYLRNSQEKHSNSSVSQYKQIQHNLNSPIHKMSPNNYHQKPVYIRSQYYC